MKNQFLKSKEKFLSWYKKHAKKIKYHLRSITESFLTGMLLYIIPNLEQINMGTLEYSAALGVLIAALRSGVKLAIPGIVSLLKYLLSLVKKITR